MTQLQHQDTGYKVYGQENTISGDFQKGSRWITEGQFKELHRYELVPGDLVLTRKGSIGKCRLIPDGIARGIADSDTIRLRLDGQVVLRQFVVLLLHQASYLQWQIESVRRGAVLGGLNTSTIATLCVVVPPIQEQQKLVETIASEAGVLATASDAAERQIQHLTQYRTRLIADVVTGKLDVREAAARLGDVLRSLSKKKMYGSPNSNPSPELGADKENHTSWERYYQVSDCSSSLRNDWYSGI